MSKHLLFHACSPVHSDFDFLVVPREEGYLLLLGALGTGLTSGRSVLVLGLGAVHLVEKGEGSGLESIGLLLKALRGDAGIAGLGLGNELTDGGDLLLDVLGLLLVDLLLELLEGLLGVVGDGVGAVGTLDSGLAGLIGLTELLGVVDHGLDLGVGKTGTGRDGNGLILVGRLVLGRDVDNGVGVDVKGDLDLGNTTVRRGDSNELEVTEELVIADELTLSLVNLDLDSGLEIGSGGEDLRLLGRDGGVAVDQTGEDTTEGLNSEREGSDIQKEDVHNLTSEDGTLNGGTNGDSLIGVDGLGSVTTEDGLDGLRDLGHTGHTTNEDNLLDILGGKTSILEGLAAGLDALLNEGTGEGLELSTSHLLVDVLGAGGISGDERQVDVGLESGRELHLGLLSGLADTLDGHAVTGQVKARLLLEVLDEVADERDVEVLTTEMGITVGGLHLEHTLVNLEDGDIEGTSTKIEDGDDAVGILVKTVSKSSGGGLVDDTEDVKTGNLTGILGGLTLRVVEVGRDGDDGVLDGLAEVGLGSLLHLVQDETTDLRRRVLLATGLDPGITVGVLDNLEGHLLDILLDLLVGVLATDQTLGGEKSVLGVDNGLTLSGNTNETLTVGSEGNDGRSCSDTWAGLVSARPAERGNSVRLTYPQHSQ